ncbi:MAG: ABC transporter permease [Planctomycetes bacterium]|nr:ABC transporter permease [Planctomycetota bacterium]
MNRLFVATLVKDVRERLRDPAALGLWLGIPLVIGVLMSLGMGGSSGPKPKSPLYVVDHDESPPSQFVANAFGFGPFGEFFEVSSPTEAEARAKLADDEGSALIVIPEGFGAALWRDEPTELQLVTNPAQRILPGIVEETLEIVPDLVFYAHRLVGEELRERFESFDEREPTDADYVAIGLEIGHDVERFQKFLLPPVLKLASAEAQPSSSKRSVSFGGAFFPSLLFMSLIFMASGCAEELWKEKRQGTLRRLVANPCGLAGFLGGKLVGALAVATGVGTLGLLLGWAAFDLEPTRLPLALVWAVGGAGLFWCLFALVQVLSTSERAANVIGNMILFPLLMLGGTFFPFDVMPGWMQAIGRFTPNGWLVLRFRELVDGPASTGAVLGAFALLLVLLAAAFALALQRFSARFVRS